jgi:L-lactate dehydrogenase complex protein LldG
MPQAESAELIATFAGRAGALGVAVQRVEHLADAAAAIVSLAHEINADRPTITAELTDAAPNLIAAIAAAGLQLVGAAAPAETRDAPLGLSLARLAIAETGSVLLAEPTLDDRGVGLLAATHLVVCPTSALVPSLDESAPVLRELASRPGGSYTTLVTGPSRTADIERVLTVGVQGPARVEVLFVDQLG